MTDAPKSGGSERCEQGMTSYCFKQIGWRNVYSSRDHCFYASLNHEYTQIIVQEKAEPSSLELC